MKVVSKRIEKDSSGFVKLIPEDSEDIWTVYNLLSVGDEIEASTLRRIQTETASGSMDSHRVRITLKIKIEAINVDLECNIIHLKGRNTREHELVKMGAYHTIDLELDRPFKLYKEVWDMFAMGLIKQAANIDQKAEIAAVVFQEGLANLCLITGSTTVLKQRVEVNIPRKRKDYSSSHEKAVTRFFAAMYQSIVHKLEIEKLKVIILASPGFLKDEFYKYLFEEAVRKEERSLIENKSKFVLVSCSSGHKHSLEEVMQDDRIQGRLSNTRFAKESHVMESFYDTLSNHPDRAFYGLNHVQQAIRLKAVKTLLLTDELFRSVDLETRKMYISLVMAVKKFGGEVLILSTSHVTGEQLSQLTGIAAILKYSCPDIDTE